MKKPVITHTFLGKTYHIDYVYRIDGMTDTDRTDGPWKMSIIHDGTFRAFSTALHEALEASGFCDTCMHNKDGESRTEDAARFLWRLYKIKD